MEDLKVLEQTKATVSEGTDGKYDKNIHIQVVSPALILKHKTKDFVTVRVKDG